MNYKNKKISIVGMRSNQAFAIPIATVLKCIITNDETGKTLSLSDGTTQFTIPFEPIEKYLIGKE